MAAENVSSQNDLKDNSRISRRAFGNLKSYVLNREWLSTYGYSVLSFALPFEISSHTLNTSALSAKWSTVKPPFTVPFGRRQNSMVHSEARLVELQFI